MENIRYCLVILSLIWNACLACRCKTCCQNLPHVKSLQYGIEYTKIEPELGIYKAENPQQFELHLKKHVNQFNNLTGSLFILPNGSKKDIYRAAFLSESPELIQELVQERQVQTMINLYNTTVFDLTSWIEQERKIFHQFGGKQYIDIPDFNYTYENEIEKQEVLTKIAYILALICQSEGNVLFHCMGGEHRSGIIYAILHRCFHQVASESIIQEYKCHCGWKSPQFIGGYKQQNVDIIQDFPTEWMEAI